MLDLSQPIDEAVAGTIQELQGLFGKPKLSKKLLKRPPFAYIRAVVLAAFEAAAVAASTTRSPSHRITTTRVGR